MREVGSLRGLVQEEPDKALPGTPGLVDKVQLEVVEEDFKEKGDHIGIYIAYRLFCLVSLRWKVSE